MELDELTASVKASLRARIEGLSIPEPNSGCWIWLGSISAGGYARITVNRSVNAHRISYAAYVDDILSDLHVLHRCDNRCCVNPEHLFLGSNRDNIADKVAKGRQARNAGIKHPSVKLTEEQALAVYADQRPFSEIARSFGLTRGTVVGIKSGKSWAFLTGGPSPKRPKPFGERQGSSKLTAAIVSEIRADSRSQSAIARTWGISQSNVSRILTREIWPHVD